MHSTCVYTPAQIQKMEELERQQVAGAGANPNYLIADVITLQSLDASSDQVKLSTTNTVSSASTSSTGSTSLTTASVNTAVEDETYLNNTITYQNSLYANNDEKDSDNGDIPDTDTDGSHARTSSTGTNGMSSTSGTDAASTTDAINDVEESLDDLVMGFDDDDYVVDSDGDGYLEPDAEALEAWSQEVISKTNILTSLLLALSSFYDAKKAVEEALTGIPLEPEGRNSYKQVLARKIRRLLKMVNVAVTNVFKLVNKENEERYKEKMSEISDKSKGKNGWESFLIGVKRVFSCGGFDQKINKEMLTETRKYLQANKKALESLRKVIASIIATLAAGAATDESSVFYMGMISALQKFDQKIEEINREIDQKIEDALEEFDETGKIETDGLEYMDDINMIEILDEYRGGIVGMQNGYRSYLSLQFFGKDLRNAVRGKLTGLTGVSSDAEIIMTSAESTLGHVTQIFDATASQMMLKTQLHNQTVQLLETQQKMKEATPYMVLGLVAAVVALVVGIIAIVVTWGGASGLVVAGWSLLASALSAGSAAAYSKASSIMADIDDIHPVEPDYNPEVEGEEDGLGKTVLGVLDRLDKEEEINMRAASRNNGVTIQTSDELYHFDSAAFAAYELKQKTIDNAIRMIFSIIKNERDLRRLVDSVLTGSSFQDSGASLLSNTVENIIGQRQMLLSAIKFQHQQVIQAKNIAKQKEIQQSKTYDSLKWQGAGAGIGLLAGIGLFLVSLIPGVGAITNIVSLTINFISIGTTIAGVAYQLHDARSGRGSAYGMMLDEGSLTELEKMLQERGGNGIDDKLDRAETEAYYEAINNGMVDTGDGFHGVNFDLMTDLYDRLGKIYTMKEILNKIRSLRSELLTIVREQLSGVSTSTSGELTQSINRANFSSAMRVMSSIAEFMQTKVEVMNKAREAEKQVTQAWVTLGVDCLLAAFAGIAKLVDLGKFLTTMSNMVPALMSLTSSTVSLISSIKTANAGYGYYNDYDVKTTVERTGRKTGNAKTVDEKIDQREYEIMCEMNQSLFITLDGVDQTMSPLATKLSSKMKALYNIKEALAVARSSMIEAKRAVGAKTVSVDFGRDLIEDQESVVLSMLDSLNKVLDTIIARQNTMSEAKKEIMMSAIRIAFSVLIMVCNYNAAKEKPKVAEKGTETQAGKVGIPGGAPAIATATAPAQTAAATVTEASATQTEANLQATTVTPATVPTVTSTAPAVVTNTATQTASAPVKGEPSKITTALKQLKEEMFTKVADKLDGSPRAWGTAAAALSLANGIANWAVSASYDGILNMQAKDEKAANGPKEAGTKTDGKKSTGKKDYYSSMDSINSRVSAADYNLAAYENNISATTYVVARNRMIVDYLLKEFIPAVSGLIEKIMDRPDATKFTSKDLQFGIPALQTEQAKLLRDLVHALQNISPKDCPALLRGNPDFSKLDTAQKAALVDALALQGTNSTQRAQVVAADLLAGLPNTDEKMAFAAHLLGSEKPAIKALAKDMIKTFSLPEKAVLISQWADKAEPEEVKAFGLSCMQDASSQEKQDLIIALAQKKDSAATIVLEAYLSTLDSKDKTAFIVQLALDDRPCAANAVLCAFSILSPEEKSQVIIEQAKTQEERAVELLLTEVKQGNLEDKIPFLAQVAAEGTSKLKEQVASLAQNLSPEAKKTFDTELEKRKAALATMVVNPSAAPLPSSPIAPVPETNMAQTSQVLLEYANQKIAEAEQTMQAMLEQTAPALDAMETQAVALDAEIATGETQLASLEETAGSEVVEPEKLLQQLKNKLAGLRAQKVAIGKSIAEAKAALAQAKEQLPAQMESAGVEIQRLLGEGQALSDPPVLPAKQQQWLEAVQKTLEGQVASIQEQVEGLRGEMGKVGEEMKGVQKQISRLQSQIAAKPETMPPTTAQGQSAARGGMTSLFGLFGSKKEDKKEPGSKLSAETPRRGVSADTAIMAAGSISKKRQDTWREEIRRQGDAFGYADKEEESLVA